MSIESVPDAETTSLIQRVDAPLPPYAEQIAAVLGAVPSGDVASPPVPRHSADQPTVAPVPASTAVELVTCPSCGTSAQVTLNRRESDDFCRTCDFPLFWTPSKIFRGEDDNGADSLRRLPGTVGRATIASLNCPTCFEPNSLSAQVCVRCGGPMHLSVEPPPLPVPPPPPVVPEPPPPEPEQVGWWVWAMLALGAAGLIALIVLITTHTIG